MRCPQLTFNCPLWITPIHLIKDLQLPVTQYNTPPRSVPHRKPKERSNLTNTLHTYMGEHRVNTELEVWLCLDFSYYRGHMTWRRHCPGAVARISKAQYKSEPVEQDEVYTHLKLYFVRVNQRVQWTGWDRLWDYILWIFDSRMLGPQEQHRWQMTNRQPW